MLYASGRDLTDTMRARFIANSSFLPNPTCRLLEALQSEEGLRLPDSDTLHADLTCFTSRHDSTGRMVLESKDAIRRKLGRSPDEADAVALTFADGLHATGSHGNMPYHGKPLPYPDLGIY